MSTHGHIATALIVSVFASCQDPPEQTDCHTDFLGYQKCVEGVVYEYPPVQAPCDVYTESKNRQHFAVYDCEEGCRTDGVTGVTFEMFCEENRPKSEGDTCEDLSDCIPVSQEDADGGSVDIFLGCDEEAGICIQMEDPCAGCMEHGACEVNLHSSADCTCDKCYYDDGTATCVPYPEHGFTCRESGTTAFLTGVWASSKNDIWIASKHGTLLHWNGISLQRWEAEGQYDFAGVWGFARNDIWLFGSHLLHYNSWGWSDVAPIWIADMWGMDSADAWAVHQSDIRRWDGNWWEVVEQLDQGWLNSVWGMAHDDVWAVGTRGTAIHWDGSSWERIPSGVVADLDGVWGSASDDFWAVGTGGLMLRWDGAEWATIDLGVDADLRDIWGRDAMDVWAVGVGVVLHWDGLSWAVVHEDGKVSHNAVFGFDDEVWIVGEQGSFFHVLP